MKVEKEQSVTHKVKEEREEEAHLNSNSKQSNKWFSKRSDRHSAPTANKQKEPDSSSRAAKSKSTPPFVQFGSPPGVASPTKKTPPMWE